MSLFAPLLPAGVCVVESRVPLASSAAYPQEAAAVARSTPDRQREFWTGRALARQALAELGFPAAPIARDQRGAPLWPAGAVGSIAHTDRYAVAAAAHACAFVSLGVDAQPVALLPPEVVVVVTSSAELVRLTLAAGDLAALLAFVAKEAVFKAWWPLTGRELDFADLELWPVQDRPAQSGELIAEFVRSAASQVTPWEVRWRVVDGLLLAAVHLAGRLQDRPESGSS